MKHTKYFKNVKVNETVFGLVYGKGRVLSVWEDSHYSFEVEYENGAVVAYTSKGYPAWNTSTFNFQTVFYPSDIEIDTVDFDPVIHVLTPKQIIKYRDNGTLEVRCPSGIFNHYEKCPREITENYLENGAFHLFRKMKF